MKVVLLALLTFVSEDMVCVAAGILVAQGRLAWATALLGSWIGIIAGDAGLWLLGRTLGRRAVALPGIRHVATPARLERAERWFSRYGIWVVLASRTLPGSRFPTYLAAGISRAGARQFLTTAVLAAIFWTPALIWLSGRFGEQLGVLFGGIEEHPWLTLFTGVVLLVLVLRAIEVAGDRLHRRRHPPPSTPED